MFSLSMNDSSKKAEESSKELEELKQSIEKERTQRLAQETLARNQVAALRTELLKALEREGELAKERRAELLAAQAKAEKERQQSEQTTAIEQERENQLAKVRQLKHSHGESWSYEESCALIQCISMIHLNCGVSISDACDTVAGCGRSLARLKTMMKHWKDHGEVLIYDDSNRGAGSIKYPGNDFYTTSLTEAQAKLLESLIDAAHSRGQTTSVSWMKSQLLLNGIKISSRSLKRNLSRLKFGYGRVDEVANLDANFERRRRAKFIARLAMTRGLESTGEYIIVFHDESYIHTNHSRNKTWGKKGKRRVRRDRRHGRIAADCRIAAEAAIIDDAR
jgi:hypothetical protein